ncbi:Beta-galactosidase [Cucumis melo var. makuwa]|uniref:Beta-galactosidase n=1 Tax=Cucumis melo var. makuwa TaxID=1194695 RepID=A0A5D3C8I9_CUCMM|nr:Beta-galactosidase [Cucumis melo var. makuwa]
MVSKRDIEHILEIQENTTNDGNQTEETTNSFSTVVAIAVDARMSAAMDEWFCRLQKTPENSFPSNLQSSAPPKSPHTPVIPLQTAPTNPFVQPFSSSGVYIAPQASICVLPPNFSRQPPLLLSNLYALPPTDLSHHLDVKNTQTHSTFEIAALEATLGTTPNTFVPMYSKNPVTLFPTLSFPYVTNTVAQFTAMEPHIGKSLLFAATAKDIWDTAWTLYSKRQNFSRLYMLRKDRQDYDFLIDLNPKFDVVRGRILGQRSIPSLMEVCFEIHLKEDRTSALNISTTPAIDSATSSARSSTNVNDKHNGKPIPVCKKCPPNDKQNTWRAYVSEFVGPSQPPDSHGNQINHDPATLGAIFQLGIPQSFDLISIDGKNPWILDSGAIDNLTGDVWGPSKITTSSGKRWFVTFIDDHTRLIWVFLVSDKSEVTSVFQDFYNIVETQFNIKIAILRSDNGREFPNHTPNEFLSSKGIVHQSSCAYTPNKMK